jgi:hypothetical protein
MPGVEGIECEDFDVGEAGVDIVILSKLLLCSERSERAVRPGAQLLLRKAAPQYSRVWLASL